MDDRWIAASTAYLSSAKARESLARDPYWPKWDTPWWHMSVLFELDRADAIPKDAAEAMFSAIEAKYLRFFPNPREPLPPGKDGHRDAMCHCGLGNMYQILKACGVDLDARSPWMRAWFLQYQLPDGGLNCDERVYERGGSSSIQSTVCALEAMLLTEREFTPSEELFLDNAAQYLIDRRLVCRRSDGAVMNPEFLKIGFPRFYDYDALRGLTALARWSVARRQTVPRDAISGILSAFKARFPDGKVRVEKSGLAAEGSHNPAADGTWGRGTASTFPLLTSARKTGVVSEVLTRRWDEAFAVLGS